MDGINAIKVEYAQILGVLINKHMKGKTNYTHVSRKLAKFVPLPFRTKLY